MIVWPISPNRESSRRSRRPLTVTITSSSSLCPCSASVRGNTVTSIDDSRSSSTNTAIWSPFLVNLRPRLVITPPTSTSAPSSRSCRSAIDCSTLRLQRRLDPEQRVVGDVEAQHLLLVAQPVALVELDVGDRPGARRTRRRAPRVPASSPLQSPNRLITPWSRSRRRITVVSITCSNTASRPRRGCPRPSNAPALISDSTVRLLSTPSGARSANSWKSEYGPFSSRSTSNCSTSPSPTLRTAESPNVIAPGLPTGRLTLAGTSSGSSAAKSVTDWLMSGVSTLMPIARASER